MKRSLLLFALIFAVAGFSQTITVDTNTYTIPQLVNTVLINSPCDSANNVTWKTGTNFGSSNGIGFFRNTNPNFPIAAGVILSTGDVANAPGPNNNDANLEDGNSAWLGDSDLEATLAAAGIPMNSTNATVLEFDFTPISPNFSFDFLFASEEYGNFQCQFSDAFAFLLTNTVTGVTTNLAVVPGTNLPISVLTIRDFLYNSGCPSVNNQFFGAYNGGISAPASPTSYNGQTTLMNASAVLTPHTLYHIKLVIADRDDYRSDSAIFIASDSFNIGQSVLGPDITVAAQTAVCFGQTYQIHSGLNPSDYTFIWKKNNIVIPGENGASLTVSGPGRYQLVYQGTGCLPVTDEIKVEFYPQIITGTPTNLFKCNTGATSYTYNLALNTPIIKTGMNAATVVTYHSSVLAAENGTGELPLNYIAAPGTTIYARVKSHNTTCYTIKQFDLLTAVPPVANRPLDMTMCARSATVNTAVFPLGSQINTILNGQDANTNLVTFYTSEANAIADTSDIGTSYIGSNNTTIYVRVQNANDSNCYSITSFILFIKSLPPVDRLQNVIVCSDYVLPALVNGNYFSQNNGNGTPYFAGHIISESQTVYIHNNPDAPNGCPANSNFKVTILKPDELAPDSQAQCGKFTLPALVAGNYFTGPNGTGTQIPSGTVITETQSLYAYYVATDPACEINDAFTVTIVPEIELAPVENVFRCSQYVLPALSAGRYFPLPDGQGTEIPAGTPITSTQTIYVYAETPAPDHCKTAKEFTVFIGLIAPSDISQCPAYELPALPIGNYYTQRAGGGTMIPAGTIISQPTTVYVYVPTPETPNCTDDVFFQIDIKQPPVDTLPNVRICEGDSYILPPLTNGEYYTRSGGLGTLLPAGTAINTTRRLFIYKRATADCDNQSTFAVNLVAKPVIDSRGDLDVCNKYELTTLAVGNYYTGPDGTGTLLPGGTILTTSQRIYIYAISRTTPACVAQSSFMVNIAALKADAPVNVEKCDRYVLPALTSGNYFTDTNGPHGTGTMLSAGHVITASQRLYVFVENAARINCTDENFFDITINVTPNVLPINDVRVCNSYTLPALTVGNYYTGPNKTGSQLAAGTVITTNQTLYVYAETATTVNCFDQEDFNITIFNVDEVDDITTCESYTLPALTVGKYYTGPNGTGTVLPAGRAITTTQTIYVFARSPFTPVCSDESSFLATIVDTPVAHAVPATLTTICDEDGTNDGVTAFNLSQLNATVAGSQTGTEFTVTYFANRADADANVNPITSTTATTVVARVSNTLTANCYALRNITLTVHKLPEPKPVGGIICYDSTNQVALKPYTLHSGLGSGYTFEWFNDNDILVGTSSSYTAVLPGEYYVIATSNITGCPSEETRVTVAPSEPAIVTYTITDDFVDNQVITVVATGVGGDYEYQLDFGPFQDSPVFENVSTGVHTITVRDKNGCGVSDAKALVVNYPKFFTPNGDSYNDTWNIVDLKAQLHSNIDIFDRYGKFITSIKPSGAGWDGTYNGATLPSTDYWFVVKYEEDGMQKEFRAHFAMKR